jgi:putative phage-type endonuclease
MNATIDRPAWLAARREVITATDAAAILGVHPYRSPREVFLDKLGYLPEQEENEAMFWGNRLEAIVGQTWAERNNRVITPGEFVRSANDPFGCTPDFYVDGNEVLEVKTAGINAGQNFGPSGGELTVPQYLVQVNFQMLVTGATKGYLTVLIAGQDYREYTIERNEKLIQRIATLCRKFYFENVQKSIAPELTGQPSDADLLSSQFPISNDELIVADELHDSYAEELSNLLREASRLELKIEQRKNALKDYMKEAGRLSTTLGDFTWKSSKPRRSVDYDAILAEMRTPPELIQKYTSEKPGSRVFRTPFKSEKA